MSDKKNKPLQIAIDGPVASGKGDIASRLAKKFDLLYIYTGAMYRALALACIENSIDFKDHKRVIPLLNKTKIDLLPDLNSDKSFKITLNDKDVTERIMLQDVAMGTSDVSTLSEVREIMVLKQKQMAQDKRVVIEGRDIGLRVLPESQLKIFLTASPDIRAKRRYLQWLEKGLDITYEETYKDTLIRDKQDTNRTIDPLQKLPDAWLLDTTNLNQDEVVKAIENELNLRNLL